MLTKVISIQSQNISSISKGVKTEIYWGNSNFHQQNLNINGNKSLKTLKLKKII